MINLFARIVEDFKKKYCQNKERRTSNLGRVDLANQLVQQKVEENPIQLRQKNAQNHNNLKNYHQ